MVFTLLYQDVCAHPIPGAHGSLERTLDSRKVIGRGDETFGRIYTYSTGMTLCFAGARGPGVAESDQQKMRDDR